MGGGQGLPNNSTHQTPTEAACVRRETLRLEHTAGVTWQLLCSAMPVHK